MSCDRSYNFFSGTVLSLWRKRKLRVGLFTAWSFPTLLAEWAIRLKNYPRIFLPTKNENSNKKLIWSGKNWNGKYGSLITKKYKIYTCNIDNIDYNYNEQNLYWAHKYLQSETKTIFPKIFVFQKEVFV